MDKDFDQLSDTIPIKLKGLGVNIYTTSYGVGMMADLNIWESFKPGMRA